MPPGKRKGDKEKPKAKGDASDTTTTADDFLVPYKPPKVRHTESDMSSADDGESVKRVKVGSPKTRKGGAGSGAVGGDVGGAVDGAVGGAAGGAVGGVVGGAKKKVVNAPAAGGEFALSANETELPMSEDQVLPLVERSSRPRRKKVLAETAIDSLKKISDAVMEIVLVESVERSVARGVSRKVREYEALLMRLIADNERLRGRLEATPASTVPVASVVAPPQRSGAGRAAGAASAGFPTLPVVKPVETWSVVVRSKTGKTAKEVVDKVVGEVGPTLGVRVHEVRPTKEGAVIRTPSEAERRKIAANKTFGEVGLEVAVKDKLGPKIVVQRVHKGISPDEFMGELHSMNLGGIVSPEEYPRAVRMVSAPWRTNEEGTTNVTLECTGAVAEHLRATGVYIKWFRFAVRVLDPIAACFRCLGFDHRVRECKFKSDVCRRCGSAGHLGSNCPNELNCRNCAFKGLQADHLMMSAACPVYAAMVARVNARH